MADDQHDLEVLRDLTLVALNCLGEVVIATCLPFEHYSKLNQALSNIHNKVQAMRGEEQTYGVPKSWGSES